MDVSFDISLDQEAFYVRDGLFCRIIKPCQQHNLVLRIEHEVILVKAVMETNTFLSHLLADLHQRLRKAFAWLNLPVMKHWIIRIVFLAGQDETVYSIPYFWR